MRLLQVDAPVKPNRVSGQEPTRPRVKVAVCHCSSLAILLKQSPPMPRLAQALQHSGYSRCFSCQRRTGNNPDDCCNGSILPNTAAYLSFPTNSAATKSASISAFTSR
jgi:hypothetical protein